MRGTPAEQVWELMWRPRLQTEWLGEGARVAFAEGARFTLADGAGAWRTGKLESFEHMRLEASLLPAAGWTQAGAAASSLTIAVEAEDGGSLVMITEEGLADEASQQEAVQFWQTALLHLRSLASAARERRERPRQAVVIIHGIGEQEPGRTLRDFVDAQVLPPSERQEHPWVKPDRASGSFELRSATYGAEDTLSRPTTELYELYWAHVIRDTTWAQVSGWTRRLLRRRLSAVPRPLRPYWMLGWIVALLVAAAVVFQALAATSVVSAPLAVTIGLVVIVLIWTLALKATTVDYLGDAARYLSARPANIAHRQAVRQAGVDLLERLHDDRRFDRIVLLGHSLGSVIAYDVLTHAWIRMHQRHERPRHGSFTAVADLEKAIQAGAGAAAGQRLQHEAWKAQRRNTQPWLVTDLVTVGSPLTYADFLMTSGRAELERGQRDRVLPACPPVLERSGDELRCSFRLGYRDRAFDTPQTFTVFDHGAPFAVTRWTNLYFRSSWGGLVGDPIGGPVASQFGPWVRDVELPPPGRRFTHTWYWRPVQGSGHIDALRSALRLSCRDDLVELGGSTPAFLRSEDSFRRG